FGDRDRLVEAKADASLIREYSRLASSDGNRAAAGRTSRRGPDGCTLTSAGRRADRCSDGRCDADFHRILFLRRSALLLEADGAKRDVLSIRRGNARQLDYESCHTAHASGLNGFDYAALDARAFFGDHESICDKGLV